MTLPTEERKNYIMKKFWALLICLNVLFGFLNISVTAEELDFEPATIEIISGGYSDLDGGYVLNYDITNNSSASVSQSVIFATFQNGEISTVSSEIATLGENSSKRKIAVLKGEKKELENAVLKTFIWENYENIRPLGKALKTEISKISEPCENVVYDFLDEKYIKLGMLSESVEFEGLTFNKDSEKDLGIQENGGLVLDGIGNTQKRSVKFHVDGNCRIKLWATSRSSTQARQVKLFDENGTEVYFNSPNGAIESGVYDYKGEGGDLYIASKNSGNIIYRLEILYTYDDDKAESLEEFSATDFDELKKALQLAEMYGGGTVLINADYIDCTSEIPMKKANKNTVTLKSGDGYTAVLDFSSYRNTFEEKNSASGRGISIEGSNYCVENLIVQKAPGNGIRFNKETAFNNRIENVVTRYNSGSGLGLNNGASNNTIKNFYSYRNCDVITSGGNADGLWIAFYAGTGNTLTDVYSWENSDDGFDSFNMFNDLTYKNCFAWRNGNSDIFSGKYDFDNGKPLDTNLNLVEKICEFDPNFKVKYESGVFELPNDKFILATSDSKTYDTISVSELTGSKWGGNPNGIKMGSGPSSSNTERPLVGPEAVRNLSNCIAFDHNSNGIDRNNSSCTLNINNCLSFDNKQLNYWIDTCTVGNFNNVYCGTNGKNSIPNGYEASQLSEEKLNEIKEFINTRIAILEETVANNKIPNGINLEDAFDLIN